MSVTLDLSVSRSSTRLTDGMVITPTMETKEESSPRFGGPLPSQHSSSKKLFKLRDVALAVQLNLKTGDLSAKPSPGKLHSDIPVDPERLAMRRGTVTGVSRSPGASRVITKPPRKSVGNVFKDIVEKGKASPIALLNMMAVREEVKRKKLMKKLKLYIRMQMLLSRWWKEHCLAEVTQTHPFYMQYQMINDLTENPADSAIDFKASYFKANKQMKMSLEAVRILTLPPGERTKEEIYYAMIALRAIDSIADYPLRMQRALAQHGLFQSYGPKRVIVKQTHAPCYFYFILYGTVVVATLDPGEPYAKTRVALRRGENFGELAIAHRSARQSTVLTMEYCEFLTIDCDTYENIFMAGGVKTIHDPDHNKFMKSLFFLRDIPLEKLNNNPKALEFCYFRRNAVMVKNSNISEWIYIVKSGSLKVYKKLQRCYPSVNKRTGNYHSKAHTDGYHSFMCQDTEFNRYAMYNDLDLPTPLSSETDYDDYFDLMNKSGDEREKENLSSLPLLQRVERMIRPRTASGVISTFGQSSVKRNLRSAKSDSHKSRRVTPIPTAILDKPENNLDPKEDHKEVREPVVLINDTGQGKRTLIDDFEHEGKKKEITQADLDPEFVLVQILTKGQAFGIQQVFLDDQPELFLVSAGAECVMLNKKIYKELVNPNMAQTLKQQLSPYPSDAVLQESLQTRVNWMQYRQITIKGLHEEQKGVSHTRLPKGRRFAFGKT